jgi:small subunit ribosomal protein S5
MEQEYSETVVQINRISKKTKGGNKIRFSALVVVGDKKGKVGAGLSKGSDVRQAITKATKYAKRRMVSVPIRGRTIPYEIYKKYGAAKIILKPAPAGSGIIAGGPVRVVLEAAGIQDAVAKRLGTRNKITNVYVTIEALRDLKKIASRKERRND